VFTVYIVTAYFVQSDDETGPSSKGELGQLGAGSLEGVACTTQRHAGLDAAKEIGTDRRF
jgi:hypothetical protein